MNLDYIAGFFDGEGCVTLSKHKAVDNEHSTYGFYIVPVIIIVQKDKRILESIRDYLNEFEIGSFIKQRKDGCSIQVISGAKRCIKFCNLFIGITVCKKEQLELMKNYIDKRLSLPPKTPYDSDDFELLDKITRLKHIKVA